MRPTRNANAKLGVMVGCGAVLGVLAAGILRADDWPQWRGPNRDAKVTGFTAPQTWPKELKQQWKTTVGEGDSTPAVVGDKVYAFGKQGGDEVIVCLNANDGKQVWQEKYPQTVNDFTSDRGHSGPRSSPAVAGGKVVTLGAGGVLSCLDADSGKVAWRKDAAKDFSLAYPPFHVASSPLILDGMCIAQLGGRGKGAVFAFDLNSGETKWKWDAEAPTYSSPVLMTVDRTKQIVAVTERSVVGLDAANGKLLWQAALGGGGGRGAGPRGAAGGAAPGTAVTVADEGGRRAGRGGRGGGGGRGMAGGMGGYNAATPIVDGQTVIVAINGHKALKVEKEGDGFVAKELWSIPDITTQFNTPVVKDGLIFGISNQGNLYCLDEKTGAKKWKDENVIGQRGFGSIVDAGSVLVALTPDGQLRVFKPSDKEYAEVAKIKVAETETQAHPVFAGKHLLIKDKDSVIAYTIE